MSEARRDATHAAGHAEIAGDHAASTTGAQRLDAAGGAQRRVTGGRIYSTLALVLSARAAVMDAKGDWPPPGNDRNATWVAAAALMLLWAFETEPRPV